MTKMVRIENADNSPYKVVVEIWDKATPAYKVGDVEHPAKPDTLVKSIFLNHPAAMTGPDCYLTSTRYMKVMEVVE